MPFGLLGISKIVASNAPKYTSLSEPFGDQGTVALYPGIKKPADHVINYEDEQLFNLMLFFQGHTSADKSKLKAMDWVSSEETFNAVVSLNATEGPELYYRFFYLKKFGEMQKDKEQPPLYDWLSFGKNIKKILFELPLYKVGLKKAEIVLGDPIAAISANDKSGGFSILVPKTPEQTDATEGKLSGMSGSFFYGVKSKLTSLDTLALAEDDTFFNATFGAGTVMSSAMIGKMNYEPKFRDKLVQITQQSELV